MLRALHVEQGTLVDHGSIGSPSGYFIGQRAESMGLSVPSNVEVMHTLGHFGMKRFAGAVMYVIAKVFANDDDALRYDDDNLCLNDWQKR